MQPDIYIESYMCNFCSIGFYELSSSKCEQCRLEYSKYLNDIKFPSKECEAIENFIKYANVIKEMYDNTISTLNNDTEIFTNSNDLSTLADRFDDIACACRYLTNITTAMCKSLNENNEE